MDCKKGEILREGYTRKSYTRKDGSKVKSTYVSPSCVQDRGKPGKGPKTLPKPDPNVHLRDYGYSVNKNAGQRQRALKRASRELGTLPVLRRLNLIANYSKSSVDKEEKMRDDVEYMKRQHKIYKKKMENQG